MDKKVYSIEIQGIQQSIDAVVALKEQLSQLDAKIIEIEQRKINIKGAIDVNTTTTVEGSSGGGATRTLTEDVALQKELNKLKNEGIALDAKIEASQSEIYKRVQATKDLYKESIADQKAIAAQERLVANEYSNTMQGIKQKLADLKAAINTTDLGDNDAIQKMTKEANELTKKLNEMEQAYGQFGRNVGNYKSAFDGAASSTDKFKIQVGAVTREFGSAREASRMLREELTRLEAEGKRNTKEADNLRKAYYNLASAQKDATVSSRAMDSAMDAMQSFTAIASVSKGFQSFFGFDNNEIGKSIQQLVALQGVLQGIEVIRKQMDTREGIGKILGKGFEKIDTWTFGLKRMTVEMKGVGTQAKVMATAINGLGVAMKGLMSIGIGAALVVLADIIQKLISQFSEWARGNADLISSEKLLDATYKVINNSLERRLQLNKALEDAGRISVVQRETKDEEAYAEAIAQANKELEYRLELNRESNKNSTFAQYALGEQNIANLNDKGVTTIGGFTESIKNIDELRARYEALSRAIETNESYVTTNKDGVIAYLTSIDDLKDELNHLEQIVGGDMVNAMMKFNLASEKDRRGLENYVRSIQNSDDMMRKSVLMRLPEIVSSKTGQLDSALKGWLDIVMRFVNSVNSEMNELKFEEMVKNILDQADETGKRLTDRRKQELTERYNKLNDAEKKAQKKNYDDAMAALDKMQANRNKKVAAGAKKDAQAILNAQNELNSLRIQLMNDGLKKQVAQLEEERRQKLAKIRLDGVMVGELTLATNKLYDKKIEDAKKAHAEELKKINDDMWRAILDKDTEAAARELEILNVKAKEVERAQEEYASSQFIASYGIQGKDRLSPQTQQALGFVSTIENDDLLKRAKEAIDMERDLATVTENVELMKLNIRETDVEIINEKKKYIEQLAELEARRSEISVQEYEEEKNIYKKNYDAISESLTQRKQLLEKDVKMQEEYLFWEGTFVAGRYKILMEEYGEEQTLAARQQLLDESYTSSMSKTFAQRMGVVERYWKKRILDENEAHETIIEKEKEVSQKRTKQAIDDEYKSYFEQQKVQSEWVKKRKESVEQEYIDQKAIIDKQLKEETSSLTQQLKKKKITRKEYNDAVKVAQERHNTQMVEAQRELDTQLTNVDKEYNKAATQLYETHYSNLVTIQEEGDKKLTEIDAAEIERRKAQNAQYYNDALQEFAKFQTSISELERKQPVKYKIDFGFTNWKETDKNNQELLNSYTLLITQINQKKAQLNNDWKSGLIDKTVYETTLTELDGFAAGVGEKMDKVRQEMSLGNKIGTFIQEAQQYINVLGNSLNQLLSTIWSAQDAEYQHMMSQLEKQISQYEEALRKQEEITREHNDAVNSIEDELRTARGDRREQLIDNLNAQMAAQRASLAEEKRIEREEKKLKEKKDREEEKQRKKEHDRAVTQAIISTALSVANAFATPPFIPVGLAMGALATALGAAQIAIIKSQKYAEGGVIQGKSHAEGGVKVLGGRAEVEGGEYITNKTTTSKNVELLDFINTKRKKINLEDMIEFYGDKSPVKRNIKAVRTKFADGGVVPTLRNDIDINDRLIQSFEDYANRPSVVSVVEINDRQAAVKNVQVLSGLDG